jgi:glutathione S-transferase
MIAESGYITHKLMTAFPNSAVEKDASDDSIFWSHFSEGSLMTQLQLGISVMITSGAVASGQMPGVEMSDEGRQAVGQYGKVLMVSHWSLYGFGWVRLMSRERWSCLTPTTI